MAGRTSVKVLGVAQRKKIENIPMSDQIKKGDIVQLKSGGPTMTVEEFSAGDFILEEALKELDKEKKGEEIEQKEEKAVCVWFDKKILKKAKFPLHTLVKTSEPKE